MADAVAETVTVAPDTVAPPAGADIVTVGGVSLLKFPEFNAATQQKIFDRTKTSGAEAIKLKGGAGWAVGIAIRDVIHAVLLNKQSLLPVSSCF